jgi:holliday junction DNA helicase RuvB
MTEGFNIRKEVGNGADREFEKQLRPDSFEDFSGQPQIIDNLKVFVQAALQRNEPLDHVCCMDPRDWVKQHLQTL